MSSTNRSQKRNAFDYYTTPIESIIDFLEAFSKQESDIFSNNNIILDSCAGGDAKTPMSYPTALQKMGVLSKNIDTIDIRTDSPSMYHGDFLLWNPPRKYNIIISNPPFLLAMDFIKKSIELCMDGGFIIMLLRLNFFGSKKRKDFWDKNMPKYTFVHHCRMSFTPDNKTDSIEYMHAVWQKGLHPNFSRLFII